MIINKYKFVSDHMQTTRKLMIKTSEFWSHSLQSLYGSWDADKTEVKMYRPNFGATYCGASMGLELMYLNN